MIDSPARPTLTPLTQVIIVFIVVLSSFMEVFDGTIVNVALPTMMGAFDVNYEKISWVVTSYVIGAALFMPLTGFFIKTLGHKKLLMISIMGFLFFSVLCGYSKTLSEISICRLLQGMCGANLLALSQYILTITFVGAAYQRALACWSVAAVIAPIAAMILGGYIVQQFSWPLIFFMNIPICLIAFFGAMSFITEAKTLEKLSMNWTGVALMFFAIGGLQLVLDKGSYWGWFHSMWVCLLIYGVVIASIFFIWLGLKHKHFFINLFLFKKKQFTFSVIGMFLFNASVLVSAILYSLLLQTVYGMSAENVAIIFIPDALSALVGLVLVVVLLKKIDLRLLIILGVGITLVGNYLMMHLSELLSLKQVILSGVLTTIGKILFALPLLIMSTDGLNKDESADASSIINFSRNIGSSFGASAIVIFLTYCTNVGWAYLHVFVSPVSAGYSFWQAKQQLFTLDTFNNPAVSSMISSQVTHQSALTSFNASFACLEVLYLLCLIPVFFLSSPKSVNLSAME